MYAMSSQLTPLYTNLIDILATQNGTVYKHHKTGNKISIWVRQDKFNINFPDNIKRIVYEYFKDLIGFFLTANVTVQDMTDHNYKLVIQIPKGHEDKLASIPVDDDKLEDKLEISKLVTSSTVDQFADVTHRINSSSRHIRIYSIPSDLIGDYVKNILELFDSKGWSVHRMAEFDAENGLKNIHFFYKQKAA